MRKNLFASFLLVAAFAVKAQDQPVKSLADKIVAVVGDRIILYSDIQNAVNSLQKENVPAYTQCLVTEQAIASKLLMLQAEKDSLPVTDDEVETELDRKIRYYINQLGSREKVELYAGKSIYQLKEDSRESIKEKMLEESMLQKIVSGIKITPSEVKTFFDRIPKDSLSIYESELEIGQIIIYPAASREMEQYIVTELNNYKKQIESKKVTFCQLARTISGPNGKDECEEFEINRNDKASYDPVFVSTAFRLKEGEVSAPIKSKFGFHLVQMVERTGDDAIVRHILRTAPVTDAEITMAKNKLDSIRSKIMTGKLGFNEAASKYSDDPMVKFSPFLINATIGQLDKDIVNIISKMNVADISEAVAFVNDQNKKGLRIVYLKSRSEPHIMNLRDDYSKISQLALEEKKNQALDNWMKTKISSYYIMVDSETSADCPQVQKYASADTKRF